MTKSSHLFGGVCMLRGADLGTHLQGWIRDIKLFSEEVNRC